MNLLMKDILNSNGCRHIQYPIDYTLPWTAEEVTRFEALNPSRLGVIPVDLFPNRSRSEICDTWATG